MTNTLPHARSLCQANHELYSPVRGACLKGLSLLLLAGTMMLAGCGGGGSSSVEQRPLTVTGNWQFTVANPPDGSFFGGLQGGFMQESGSTVTGAATYAVSLSKLVAPCNSGSAAITGTISGQTVNFTATAGTQTFTFTGVLSLYGSTIAGTYTSTAGTAPDGSPCGTAQTGLQWGATSVPPLTGSIQGNFHSTGGAAGLSNQDFPVTGALTQGENTGASSASVTGTLSFLNSVTNQSYYPCFTQASVNGQISGNVVTLQITGTDGATWGDIGEPASLYGSTGINPATFDFATGGYILQGVQPTYMVATPACPGSLGNASTAGDFGNICLGVNGASACTQPITLVPAALTFPPLAVDQTSKQTITLSNVSNSTINGLTATLVNGATSGNNFSETDNCGVNGTPSQGTPFDLISEQTGLSGWYCTITIIFSPASACTGQCPSSVTATLTVNSPVSTDNDTAFSVPVTGEVLDGGDALTSELGGGHPVQNKTLPSSSCRTWRDVEHHAEIN